MKIRTFQFNPVQVNTYVIYNDNNECIIIDPGCFFPDEKSVLLNFIVDNELIIKHVLNTHLHFDHVLGLNFIYDQFKMKTEANKEDEFLLEMLPEQLEMFGFGKYEDKIPQIGKYLEEGDIITLGDEQFYILHVPGHSPGSLVFYNQSSECAFVGDVLFRGGIGRTDLVGGNMQQLLDGIQQKLFKLAPNTVVYSGHGPITTIGDEMRNNPFF